MRAACENAPIHAVCEFARQEALHDSFFAIFGSACIFARVCLRCLRFVLPTCYTLSASFWHRMHMLFVGEQAIGMKLRTWIEN